MPRSSTYFTPHELMTSRAVSGSELTSSVTIDTCMCPLTLMRRCRRDAPLGRARIVYRCIVSYTPGNAAENPQERLLAAFPGTICQTKFGRLRHGPKTD